MRYLSLFFLIIIFSCSPLMDKEKYVTLSTLDEQRFVFAKSDSLRVYKEYDRSKIFSDSCEKYHLNCIIEGRELNAHFKGGPKDFREIFYKNLNIPRGSKRSKIRIDILIGKQNSINKIEVSDYKNEAIKNEIIRVLQLPQLNNWKSASSSGVILNYEITFYLYIKTKQPDQDS